MMEFIAKSSISKKIYKLALMLKNLDVNVYIYGDKGVGKSFLAKFIAPDAVLYNEKLNDKNLTIIVENRTDFPLDFERIIAIGNKPLNNNLLKENFPIEIELKPLSQREEDIKAFKEFFYNQATNELDIYKKIVDVDTRNLHTIKQSIYKQLLCSDYTKDEVIKILKDFFSKNYTENDSYHSMLKIFDKALIEVLIEKYKSKLQVAKHLKINRHTLTKKVDELEE